MSAQQDKPPVIIGSGKILPVIGGNKDVAKAASKEFISMREMLAMKDLVIQSQMTLILELVRRLGGEVRIRKSVEMENDLVLVTYDDPVSNEVVMLTRKDVDNGDEPTNSPKI